MNTAQSAVEEINILNSDQDENKNQYLTFILAGEEYGIDILRVQEIKGWDSVTKIPNAPPYIKGVMNLRGTIVPIIDLRQRFNLETLEYGLMTVVIVLKVQDHNRNRTMGIVVDAVSDVYDLSTEHMKPPPDFGDVISVEFLKGLATVDNKMVIILDIDHLLTNNEMSLLNSVSSSSSSAGSSATNNRSIQPRATLDIALLENTFSALAPQGEHLAQSFYQELFSRYPKVKPLFAHLDMKEQEAKLLAALKLVIGNLRNPEALQETLSNLGKRHQNYGADAGMYKAVSSTLIDVMKDTAGTAWTEEVNQAWTSALHHIAQTMMSAVSN